MGLKSTRDRYGPVAVSMHWLSALLIIILIASGFRAANTVDAAAKAAILRVHAHAPQSDTDRTDYHRWGEREKKFAPV